MPINWGRQISMSQLDVTPKNYAPMPQCPSRENMRLTGMAVADASLNENSLDVRH